MSERDAAFYIVDIFIAIGKIEIYTERFESAQELSGAMLEWDATVRQLEIIGEATKWLIKLNLLDNRKYRKIVDFRNLIAHAYFGIDEEEVWSVVKDKLTIFQEDLKELILERNIALTEALFYAKKEIDHSRLTELLDTLEKIDLSGKM